MLDLELHRQTYPAEVLPAGQGPIEQVAAVTTPLLLVSGSDAPNRQQAELFADALRASDKTVALRIFAGEGHQLRRPENITALYDVSASWFRAHDR